MASIFGHGMLAYTISKIAKNKNTKRLIVLAIFSSILPDFDVIAFKFGVPYTHPFGHRGFTHSILFALLWAYIAMLIFGKAEKLRWFLVIFLSTISHGILDAMTSGGRGVGFLIPIINDRFFLPFREIQVSPIRIHQFFSEWGIKVLLSEFKYIFIPCLIGLLINLVFLKFKK